MVPLVLKSYTSHAPEKSMPVMGLGIFELDANVEVV